MEKHVTSFVCALSCLLASGCSFGQSMNSFGDFGYRGIFLREFATKQINVEEAKTLIDLPRGLLRRKEKNRNSVEDISLMLTQYASVLTTVKYYVSDRDEQQVRSDLFQGTDFKHLLESNHYEPFGQMSVRYLFVDDELLDDMEQQNRVFIEEGTYITTPFNKPYTYHTNEEGELIVQTHSFAELPASVGGGIGSTFRQDCEFVFDEEGKIGLWQSSLGLYTSTPSGTVKEGYIFEVAFAWTDK